MARQRRQRNSDSKVSEPATSENGPDRIGPALGESAEAETTGRFLVIMGDETLGSEVRTKALLSKKAGIKAVALSSDFGDAEGVARAMHQGDCVYLEHLGIAVVSGDGDRMSALASVAADDQGQVLAVEPEYVCRALAVDVDDPLASTQGSGALPNAALDYLRGYRDAVSHLYDQLAGAEPELLGQAAAAAIGDTAQFTWGLIATRAHTSRYDGRGIRVAVLDTGLNLAHPDFQGRSITHRSFIAGETVEDGNRHGTHCTGTACGPRQPGQGPRYGVAYRSQIFVGKVLSNAGSGGTGEIAAGMEWAVANRCRVISMSLGARINQKIMAFEVASRRALAAGSLVVAAAGNNAQRPGNFGFVEPPANSDDALAVAAIDRNLAIARFSARSSSLSGGEVNLAAPGVDVYSSVPVSMGRYGRLNGTSMATPHVAGIAALWAQATGAQGRDLWNIVVRRARRLNLPTADVGAGLVQAPQ